MGNSAEMGQTVTTLISEIKPSDYHVNELQAEVEVSSSDKV